MCFQTAEDYGLLKCISCHEILGVRNTQERYSVRLFKWSVTLRRSRGLDWETCSVQEIVSAQLLALIEDQAAYRFLAYTGDAEDSNTALMVIESLTSLPNVDTLSLLADSFGSSTPI